MKLADNNKKINKTVAPSTPDAPSTAGLLS